MKIRFMAAGGTIDKIYFDSKSKYEVGALRVGNILRESGVAFEYECESLLRKDSLEMNDEDRNAILNRVMECPERHVVITHGTDTMAETARLLMRVKDKVVVLTGAMQPAAFRSSDAAFNVGCAVAAVQCMPDGVYIAMSGRIFEAANVRKNLEKGVFEELDKHMQCGRCPHPR